ncbi:MAG: HAD family hydrolase [Desulfitobacteriaceae bacterium]
MAKRIIIPYIFDLDGTLFDSQHLAILAYTKVLEQLGNHSETHLGLSLTNLIGMTGDEAFRILLPGSPPEVRQQAIELLEEVEQDILLTEGRLFPGVKETLATLKDRGYPLFIASNGGARYVLRVLELHGIRLLFDGVYCAGLQGTASKVDLVKLILAQTGNAGIMVGDRSSDVEAGKKNGLLTVGCAYGFGSSEELAAADIVIRDINELQAMSLQ